MKIVEILSYKDDIEEYIEDILVILKQNGISSFPLGKFMDILKKEFPTIVDDDYKDKIREIIGKNTNIVKGIFGNKIYFVADENESTKSIKTQNNPNNDDFEKLIKKGLEQKTGIKI